ARVGMPRELTCTERAFNLSFSLGEKWKISTPKMGPAEVTREEPDYIPAWSLKHNDLTPGTHLLSLFEMSFNAESLGYPIHQQNYISPSYNNSFRAIDKSHCLLPNINFSLPINYRTSLNHL